MTKKKKNSFVKEIDSITGLNNPNLTSPMILNVFYRANNISPRIEIHFLT